MTHAIGPRLVLQWTDTNETQAVMGLQDRQMLFAILFTDKPEHGAVRAAHLQAHIDWLEQHKDIVPIGGSLRSEPEDTPKGGLWIAHAHSKDQLHQLIRTDPFYTAGLRQSYEILHWSKANDERQALI